MATANFMDYLSEKICSLSSRMWSNSLQPNSTSFLMNGNYNVQQYDLSAVLGEIKDKMDYQNAINPTYQFASLHRFTTGIFGSLNILNSMKKPVSSNMTEKGFPHLFNFISESYRPKYEPRDSFLMSPDSKFLNPAKENIHILNKKCDTMQKEKVSNSQVIEMTVDVGQLPANEKCETVKKVCDISPTVRLNIELAHRKTKEMSKRSKKRRRRQKKSELVNISNSTSASDDEDADNDECPPVTDSICFLSKSPDLGCMLSVTHNIQLSPHNSFLIPVTSDSDDDSEWETFEEIEISAVNSASSNDTNYDDSSSSNSSPVKCESLKPSSFKTSVHVSSIISFVVPEDDSDDDSDWDTCETSTFPENTDFELSGLYFANLCTPENYFKSSCCSTDFTSEADFEEVLQQRVDILEANNKWNNLDDCLSSKSVSKVTFAPDENLVEVFPVEIFERKGEWEMYATARDRFKRKISELEKVISPCLMSEHRSKMFQKLVEPNL